MWTERNETSVCNGSGQNNSMAVVDDRILAVASDTAAASTPTISHLNVNKSNKVHIGPKFVSVTQNVQNAEMIQGRILGLQLVSSNNVRRLRCSVAVCVCWSFLVASGLAVYLIILLTQQSFLDIGLTESWYLRRGDWQARPAYSYKFLNLPVSYVIIGHSATRYCNRKFSCIDLMVDIQQDHLRRLEQDIGPNFLVGGNGYIFEGRGANVLGAMVRFWNTRSISIMFLGNYVTDITDDKQFKHINILLEKLVELRVLTPNYIVYGECQVRTQTVPPGPHVMQSIDQISHWNSENVTACLPR